MGYNKFISGNNVLLDLSGDDLTDDTTLVQSGKKYHDRSGAARVGTGVVPTGNQDITDLTSYDVTAKATAQISATERAKIIAGNIKKDVTILGVTGTYEGGGGSGAKPSYLISDGDVVSAFYFNTAYSLDSFLASLTYDQIDQTYGFSFAYLGLDYLIAIDLSTITGAGLTGYVLFWGDPTFPNVLYSTTIFDLSAIIATLVVTETGWQTSIFAPSASVTMTEATSDASFVSEMDYFIAQSSIAFGISIPTLNAPSININQETLSITNPSSNGNFVSKFFIYVDGVKTYETANTSYSLSSIPANTASITVTAVGNGFNESNKSVAKTYTKYFSVSFYDGQSQMTGSPVSVAYNTTVSQAVSAGSINTTKTGYDFKGWYSDSGLTTNVPTSTPITSNMTLYGKWVESPYITEDNDPTNNSAFDYLIFGAFSPSGKYFACMNNSRYIHIYDTSTNPWTRNVYWQTSGASGTSAMYRNFVWVTDSLLISLQATGLKAYTYSGLNYLTDSTSTYIPSTSISNSYSDREQSISNMNSNGKFAVANYAGSSTQIYLFDTSTTPFTKTTTSVSHTFKDVGLLNDDTILGYTEINYVQGIYKTDDSLFYGCKVQADYNRKFYCLNDYIWLNRDHETYDTNSGLVCLKYANGSTTQVYREQISTNQASNYHYAYNVVDGVSIKSSSSSVVVKNSSGTTIQNASVTTDHGILFISPAGDKAVARVKTTNALKTFTITPLT